ncbi:hypothetical protein ACQBAT_02660 [Ornithinimicrobium sp. Y1847]|uniref:hypothetical protein n=1 Tax=Ornithinimicrobium sp. Y1847 TaxID=3405419 RepID=UPI003B684644
MRSSPDSEIAKQVVIDLGRQGPLPGRPGGRTCLACLAGDVLDQLLDPVSEPVQVLGRVWVVS